MDAASRNFGFFLLALLAFICFHAFWRVSDLREKLFVAQEALADCQEESIASQGEVERYRAEEERRRKLEERIRRDREARSDETVKKAKQLVKAFPCQLELINWMGRVEGDADLPSRSLKAAIEWEKGEGPDPGFTAAQKRRLARAMRENPLPECTEQEGAEP